MSKLFLVLLEQPRRPRFSTGQLDKLADVFVNLGIVLVGSVIIPGIIPGIQRTNLLLLIFEVGGALFLWMFAFLLMKEVNF